MFEAKAVPAPRCSSSPTELAGEPIRKSGLLATVRELLRRPFVAQQRVAIVCANHLSGRFLEELQNGFVGEVKILGLYDDRSLPRGYEPPLGVTGRVDDLIEYVRDHPLDHVILALPSSASSRIEELTARLRSLPVSIVVLSEDAFSRKGTETEGEHTGDAFRLAGMLLNRMVDKPMSRFDLFQKRSMDVVIALSAVVLLSPLLVLIALAIVLDSPGGFLFRQERIGFNNRPFTMLKFRTMRSDAPDQEGVGGTLPGDPRVTRVGRFLRRFSLDELPQFINVLRGEMSIVGPRPQALNMRVGERNYSSAVVEYIERHKVKPGLTGLAQISGSRGGIHTVEKAAWAVSKDLEYIQNWSIWLDVVIMWRTAIMMVSGRDAV